MPNETHSLKSLKDWHTDCWAMLPIRSGYFTSVFTPWAACALEPLLCVAAMLVCEAKEEAMPTLLSHSTRWVW